MLKGKTVAPLTLGCKVNQYETDGMIELLKGAGMTAVSFEEKADVYLINTCSVTNMADKKSRQMIHRAKKLNPDAVVIAAGCYVQAAKDKLMEDDRISIIIGNNKKKDIVQILEDYLEIGVTDEGMLDIAAEKEYEPLTINSTLEHTRAYVKIQDGCNQFCSYCIIPYVRGRIRSRELASITEEVERLAQTGVKEIVLTGIHISSYGKDKENEVGLADVIDAISKIESIERIRLGSLEPGIITEDFVKTLSALPKFCPHFHLSLQSGCDATLKRMNRRYTSGEYYEKCILIRKYFKHPALTTDVIVGFPGETEEEFAITRDFLNKVDFYETHIFKYSRREGTKAAAMKDQVPDQIKAARSAELLELNRKKQAVYEERLLGKLKDVCEKKNVMLEHLYHKPLLVPEEILETLKEYREMVKPFVCNTSLYLWNALKEGKTVLLEGQLGTLKDPDHGIYPMVTSSSTLAAYGAIGAGLPPYEITKIVTVCKAYSSAVGAGAFVSEIFGEEADELRKRGGDGGEFGATTGRPRRMGWFDCVASKYGCRMQGATDVAFTVLDVLGYLDEIPVCTGYEIDGEVTTDFPTTAQLEKAKPVLEKLPGWKSDIRGIRKYEDLPENCKKYIEFVEEHIGFPITMVSNGPGRDDIIYRESKLSK